MPLSHQTAPRDRSLEDRSLDQSPDDSSPDDGSLDDRALALALLGRDADAATTAWERYSPLVLGFLRRFFASCPDQQDLCQEVFLRFFRRIDELRDPSALRGFLISICLGVARNEHRRGRVRRWVRLTASGDLPDVPGGGFDPEAREATSHLRALLERVSSEDRSLFLTRYVEEREITDIAVLHGLSFGTAKRRLARATRRVNAKLSRDPLLAGYVGGGRTHAAPARSARRASPVAKEATRHVG